MNLAKTRLNKELKEYSSQSNNTSNEIYLYLRNQLSIYSWQAKLKGPLDSPYHEGTFYVNIDVPEDYPISPPKCKFITKVFHPNIPFIISAINHYS